jgi:uncharacterized flavoprotein (TIGR03862 family)
MVNTRKHIAIIGAGPSGLMAAEILATAGHVVTLYDRMPSPGRKFLMAGRGGLNLTHSEPLESFLTRYAAAADWLAPSIRAFSPEALRAWCEGLGQETFIGSSGRVFPRNMKAAALLRAWLKRLEQLGVRYVGRHTWDGWAGTALRFTNAAGKTFLVEPDATLLALGGASWPRLGSDGLWTKILAINGIKIAPLRPSNVGFAVPWSEHFATRFAGMPLKSIALTYDKITHRGEAMITAKGIEGGAVYALSGALRDAIEAKGSITLELDLRPAMSVGALTKKLQAPRGSKSLSNFLRNAGFSPIDIGLLNEVVPRDKLSKADAAFLAIRLKSLPITLTATSGIGRAISSAGGVVRDAVTDGFMLHAKPGVFVAGEMLDWEAPTGGYLLQGCFSTAVIAAESILRYLGD